MVTNLGLSAPAIEDLLDRGLAIVEVFFCIGRPLVSNPPHPASARIDLLFNCSGVPTIKALKSLSFGRTPDEVVDELDVSCLVREQPSPGTPAIKEDLLLIVIKFLFYRLEQ